MSVSSGSSSVGKISTEYLEELRIQLKNNQHRQSTKANYHGVWNNFNKFVIKLDNIPNSWEERTSLYCTFLTEIGTQSSTLKSYVSAIKYKVKTDDPKYNWEDDLVMLSALTRACKLKNDRITTRLPNQTWFARMYSVRT